MVEGCGMKGIAAEGVFCLFPPRLHTALEKTLVKADESEVQLLPHAVSTVSPVEKAMMSSDRVT